jgi:hypothetical protein
LLLLVVRITIQIDPAVVGNTLPEAKVQLICPTAQKVAKLSCTYVQPELDCTGTVVTVKATPLLATPPTVTTTFPVVAPAGTDVTMLVVLQLVGVAAVPLNVTALDPCDDPKFDPVIVTELPTGPDDALRPVMLGTGLEFPAAGPPPQPTPSTVSPNTNKNRIALVLGRIESSFELRKSLVTESLGRLKLCNPT